MNILRACALCIVELVFLISLMSVAHSSTVLPVEIYFLSGKPIPGEGLETSVFDMDYTMTRLGDEVLALAANPKAHLIVLGGTDSRECTGSDCMALSLRRAQYVTEWLLANGVSRRQLVDPVGYGSTQPVADNETEEGRQRNRYAEISIYFVDK
jgi:hypothetical protein